MGEGNTDKKDGEIEFFFVCAHVCVYVCEHMGVRLIEMQQSKRSV